jgi:hypothetical protein
LLRFAVAGAAGRFRCSAGAALAAGFGLAAFALAGFGLARCGLAREGEAPGMASHSSVPGEGVSGRFRLGLTRAA